MEDKTQKLKITKRALVQRIDRYLSRKGQKMVAVYGTGEWVVVDESGNCVRRITNLSEFAVTISILKKWEDYP